MQYESESSDKPAPFFSLLSISAPFAGVAFAFLGESLYRMARPNDDTMFSAVVFVVLPILTALLAGMFLAAAAAWREEKCTPLRWLGLLINLAPIVYVIIASSL